MTKEQCPKGWAVKPLKKVAEIQRKSVSAAKIESGTMYVGLEHIDGSGSFVNPPTVDTGELASTKFVFGPDHLLYGKLRPYLKKIVRPSFPGVCSTDILPILPDKGVLDKNYLYYYLRQATQINLATARATGANLPRLSPKILSEFPVLLPPLPEQKRIAAILDKADAIRRKRQEAIALADTFLRSVFLKMFGDPVTNPMGWGERPFDDVVLNIVGGWSAKGEDRLPQIEEMAVLKVSAVTYGVYRPDKCKVVEDIPKNKKLIIPQVGDLLFSRANTRQLVAATCIVTEARENVFLPDKLWRIDCDKDLILPEYIKFLFSHPRFREQMSHHATGTSGSMLNISKQKLLEVVVPVPDYEKQKKFAELFWKMDSLFSKLHGAHKDSNNNFSSLQQRAFRGDL